MQYRCRSCLMDEIQACKMHSTSMNEPSLLLCSLISSCPPPPPPAPPLLPPTCMLLSHMPRRRRLVFPLPVCDPAHWPKPPHPLCLPHPGVEPPLWVVPQCCPARPPAHSAALSWLISVSLMPGRLNVSSENSPLPFSIYLFLSISISHQINVCSHTVLRCSGLGISLFPVQSILHKPLDCEDRKSPREHANGVPETDTPQ